MAGLGSTRVFAGTGRSVKVIGLRRRPLADVYHRLVTGSWWKLLAFYAAVFFSTQAVFAVLHLALAAGDPGAPGFLPALVAGEASMAAAPPLTARWAVEGVVSTVESFVRWLELGVGAGIIMAKFSRLPARVMFSRQAVIAPHQGGHALLFRMANERTTHLVDAKVAAMLVLNEPGEDGEMVRRAHDLAFARGGTALFSHAWTAVHPIGRDSPLHGATALALAEAEAELIVTLSGFDEALARVVHARHVYSARRIRWNARFKEIVTSHPSGARTVDYRRFHDTVPLEEPAAGRRAG